MEREKERERWYNAFSSRLELPGVLSNESIPLYIQNLTILHIQTRTHLPSASPVTEKPEDVCCFQIAANCSYYILFLT